MITLVFGVTTAAARADDGTTSTEPPTTAVSQGTVGAPVSVPAGSVVTSPDPGGTPGSVTVTIVVSPPPGPPATENAVQPAAGLLQPNAGLQPAAEGQPTVAGGVGQPAAAGTIPGSPAGTPQVGTTTQDDALASEQSNTTGPEPAPDDEETGNGDVLVVPQPSLVGSQQQAAATSVSVQTDPLNGSVTVQIGIAGNTAGTTQANTAEATANADTTRIIVPIPAATTPVAPPTQDGVNPPAQNDTPSTTAGSSTSVAQSTQPTSGPPAAETAGQGSGGSQKTDAQTAAASASTRQSGAKNKKVGVRVASPGDDGSVDQTNSATATATSTGATDDPLSATTNAEATQVAPSNTNVNIRVESPGDNGAVNQTNTATATATSSGAVGGATDTATATQIAPTNTNVTLRISSPGTDGTVTQGNTATQNTTTAGPVSVGATTNAGNSNVTIALGDAGLLPTGVGSTWDWNWVWDSANGLGGPTVADQVASEIASWQWSWGTPSDIGPSSGANIAAASPLSPAGSPDQASNTGTGSTPPAEGTWNWTWTWTWQQDDGSNWSWEWDWSRPCACSWDWNWNWDWSTGDATATGANGELPNPLTDPSVAAAADPNAVGSDSQASIEARLGANALGTLVGPIAQSNSSTADADAVSTSLVTRLAVTLPDTQVTQRTAEEQVAQASASSTQTAPTNVAEVTQIGPANAGSNPAADLTVAQANDVAAVAAAVNLSDVTQTALQGQLTGESVVVLPTVDQAVETHQFATAESFAEQSQASNRVVVDSGFPAGQSNVVQQANTVTGDAAVANESVVVQSSEQAQASGGEGIQTSAQYASISQAGLASIEASQLESINTTIVSTDEAVDDDAASTRSAPVVAPTIPLVPPTTMTQVSQTNADASVANESEIDQFSAQLQVASPSAESAAAVAAVEQAASATAGATQAATFNAVVLPGQLEAQGTSASSVAPAPRLEIVQANLASAVSVSANTSFVSQESVQSQNGAKNSTADSAQVATVSQQTQARITAAQTGVGNVADDSTLEPFGFFGQGNGAIADASAGNSSAVGQSVEQEQLDTTNAATEGYNDTTVEQSNAAEANASMANVVNTGQYVDGLAIIDAVSEAAALNISLVAQTVEQSQEILPPEPPKPPRPPGGGDGHGGHGDGTGSAGGDGTGHPAGGGDDHGAQASGPPGGTSAAGHGSTRDESGGTPWSGTGAVSVMQELAIQTGSGAEQGDAQLGASSDELSAAEAFEPGPNPTETYLTTIGATGGPSSSSSLLLRSATTSVVVVDISGVWINGVRTAIAVQTEPDNETASGAHVERRVSPAAPVDDTPPRGPPAVKATSGAAPAPGSAGGGQTAALAARASPISPDGGEIQDPPTLLEPPGAVVTLLDTPG